MKRNQGIRLAIFIISFAFFLMLPFHQYWVLEYTEGHKILFQVKPVPCEKPNCIDFQSVEALAPAAPGATDLGIGFVYFDLSGETARLAGVAKERKAVPPKTPFLEVRDLKLTPDRKNYVVPLKFHYYTENPAEAANLRLQMIPVKEIKLEVEVFPNGQAQPGKLLMK